MSPGQQVRGSGGSRLAALSVCSSAFLLFAAQPILTRLLQPSFGGSPAVWNSVMLSFQVLLLAGYAWAHVSLLRLAPSRQRRAQALILLAPLGLAVLAGRLPLVPPAVALTPGGWPFLAILGLALAAAAPPVLALSSNAPLLQGWHAQVRPGEDPYRLYAASNLGSLAALLAYPLLIEPGLGLRQQLWLWAAAYLLFVGSTMWFARQPVAVSAPTTRPEADNHPGWSERLAWMGLSALGSALLMAVSLHINTDLASLPLLWVAPLGLYLGTFVIAFGTGVSASARRLLGVLAATAISIGLSLLLLDRNGPFGLLLATDLLVLFAGCLLAHGDLAARRPAPSRLGAFYLWVSLGGALGGLASSLAAPLLFDTVVEYPLALALAGLLVCPPGASRLRLVPPFALPACAFLLCVLAGAMIGSDGSSRAAWELWRLLPVGLLLVGMLVWRFPGQFGGVALCVALLVVSGEARLEHALEERRSFFGVLRVDESDGLRTMVHGTTLHGSELLAPERRGAATTYYHAASPMGALTAEATRGQRVCVVGLGVGALAVQARPQVRLTYFELDPAVEELARRWFSFLAASPADVDVVIGDARLTLGQLEGPRCDLLVVDAFSSDSIPLHLLTLEALEVYRAAMTPSGRLAFHITNRHLDLRPVLHGGAEALGWQAAACDYVPDESERAGGATVSNVVVLGAEPLQLPPCRRAGSETTWRQPPPGGDMRRWTDDEASVLPLFWSSLVD